MQTALTRKRPLSKAGPKPANRGFTLIELLGVIAIIALLLAILLPTLNKVKEKAKTVLCKTRLKWCHDVMRLFTADHNGRFPRYYWNGVDSSGNNGHWWIQSLRPYNSEPDLLVCPKAYRKPSSKHFIPKDNSTQWASTYHSETPPDIDGKTTYGSIGINWWVMNCSGSASGGPFYPDYHEHDPKIYWRKLPITGAYRVPLFLDAIWTEGRPMDIDKASRNQFDRDNYMHCFAINRHNGFVNSVFCDGSVRKVGLKGLWRLKWSRNFDTNNAQANAPPAEWYWMKNFSDKH